MKKGRATIRAKIILSSKEALISSKSQLGKMIQQDLSNMILKFSQKEQAIINTWNHHPYIMGKLPRNYDTRNLRLLDQDMTDAFIRLLKKTIRKIGSKKIIQSIDDYLIACSNGKHIWNRTNHGFKNLHGFLAKIYKLGLEGGEGWWVENVVTNIKNDLTSEKIIDKSSELTKFIASLYASYVLGTSSYEISNPSKDYYHMYHIKQRILRRLRGKKDHESIEMVFSYLVEAATQAYTNSVIYPATLNSSNMWNIVFPQYVKSHR